MPCTRRSRSSSSLLDGDVSPVLLARATMPVTTPKLTPRLRAASPVKSVWQRATKKIWELDFFDDKENIRSGNYREALRSLRSARPG